MSAPSYEQFTSAHSSRRKGREVSGQKSVPYHAVFSPRLSGRYLRPGIEENGKGQTRCGRRHAFAEPFLQSLWRYPKQARELFEAEVMRILEHTQEIKHIIAALLGMRAGFVGRHERELPGNTTGYAGPC